jgi:putative PIN family toxin of toxin-antitoxin system
VKVFLDTNVLVSSFATRGLSADVVRVVMAEHELITGEVVLSEFRRVLVEKFGVVEHRVLEVERLLRKFHVEPKPVNPPQIQVRDKDDSWILATALEAGADVLVTGDKDLLGIRIQVEHIQIMSPRDFWNMLRP